MPSQTIVYTESMVGSGHPTLSDTLNRLTLVDHETDGTHSTAIIDTTHFKANIVDTDGTLAANSDLRLATQKATKTYVDTKTAAATAALIPATTALIFVQAAPPSGWTKVVTNNDKALRIVSGTGGGTGGTHALSSPPSTAHTHSTPAHTHVLGTSSVSNGSATGATHWIDGGAGQLTARALGSTTVNTMIGTTTSGGSGTSGSDGPTAFSPQYVDGIVCTKD